MPSPLANFHEAETIKLILMGDSGAGKTGALASLAEAGYNLFIADFDNGLAALYDVLKGKPEALARVSYETLTDPFKFVAGQTVPTAAIAWGKLGEIMTNWPGKGNLTTWGPNDIFVLDSLDHAGMAAMRHHLQMNAKLAALPSFNDWNGPQQYIERFVEAVTSKQVKCNVIVITHVTILGDQVSAISPESGKKIKETIVGTERGYPASLGRAITKDIGSYFNMVVLSRSDTSTTPPMRLLHTDSLGINELKNSAPTRLKKTYPMKTGLAEIFAAIRGSSPGATPTTPVGQ